MYGTVYGSPVCCRLYVHCNMQLQWGLVRSSSMTIYIVTKMLCRRKYKKCSQKQNKGISNQGIPVALAVCAFAAIQFVVMYSNVKTTMCDGCHIDMQCSSEKVVLPCLGFHRKTAWLYNVSCLVFVTKPSTVQNVSQSSRSTKKEWLFHLCRARCFNIPFTT